MIHRINSKIILTLLLFITEAVPSFAQSITSFTASDSIALSVGTNTNTTVVNEGDGRTTKTYTVTLPAPAITTGGSLTALTSTYGTASASGNFTISGSNMTEGISVTPPNGFLVSLDNSTFSSTVTVGSSGTISSTPVYVRPGATTAVDTYIALTSSGATADPALDNVHIQSNNTNTAIAVFGDVITLSFTADVAIQTPTITIAGATATVTNTSGNNWQGTITVDNSKPQGIASVSITAINLAGTASTTIAAMSDGSSVRIYWPPPTISSFTPVLGPTGSQGSTTITITGTGFDATPANNLVFFGAVSSIPSAGSATSLAVTVPAGASYEYLSVLNKQTGLSANSYSGNVSRPIFLPTYYNEGALTSYAPTPDYQANGASVHLYVLATADIDGDGKPDIITSSSNTHIVRIFLNNTTSPGSNIDLQTAFNQTTSNNNTYCLRTTVGDIDGDGKQDIIVANQFISGGDFSIAVLRNTSTPGNVSFELNEFVMPTNFQVGQVLLCDFDGDGKPDILTSNGVVNVATLVLAVHKNLSTPGSINITNAFTANTQTIINAGFGNIFIGDFDGDGKPDMGSIANFTSNTNGGTAIIYQNNSSIGNISFPADYTTSQIVGTKSSAILARDINGDGKPDLVTTNETGNNLTYCLNTSTGASNFSFDAKVGLPIGTPGYSVSVGGISGIGKMDLIATGPKSSTGTSTINIFRNNTDAGGSVSMSPKKTFSYSVSPIITGYLLVNFCDLNGDGVPEMILTDDSKLYIFKGSLKTKMMRPILPF